MNRTYSAPNAAAFRRTAPTVPRVPNRQPEPPTCNHRTFPADIHYTAPEEMKAMSDEMHRRPSIDMDRWLATRSADCQAHRAHLTRLAIYGTAPAVVATCIGLWFGWELLAAAGVVAFGLVVAVALFRSRA